MKKSNLNENVIKNIGLLCQYKGITKVDIANLFGEFPKGNTNKYFSNLCNYFNISMKTLTSEKLNFDDITKKYFLD